MQITLKNLSEDVKGIVELNNGEVITLDELSQREIECNDSSIIFSVIYNRDFTFGFKPNEDAAKPSEKLGNKMADKFMNSIDKALLILKNTYKISNLSDGMVIEINDRAHYVELTKMQSFFKCIPALYYFGAVEAENAEIDVISSYAVNRVGFLKFYKWLFRFIDFRSGFFHIVRYKVHMKRQKKISEDEVLTERFKRLYSLSLQERDYQFRPLRVIADKIIESVKKKIPKRLWNKLSAKLSAMINN